MKFKTLAIITSMVAFLLGCAYLFAGTIIVGRWQIEPTTGVLLLCRRIGCLYLGLSVMYFLSRSAPLSVARTALSAGTAIALSILAITGVYELIAGHAGRGILVSVLLESLIATGFIMILMTERKSKL